MSRPDAIALCWGKLPPRFSGYPHSIVLLPMGVTLEQVGGPDRHTAGIFLIDPDCAELALNDAALDAYISARVPVFLFASRPRDLRPFLRRADAFRRRGITIEVVA